MTYTVYFERQQQGQMWEGCLAAVFTFLALSAVADGLGVPDSRHASAQVLAGDWNQQWDEIVRALDESDAARPAECWPDEQASDASHSRDSVSADSHAVGADGPAPVPFTLKLTEANLVAELQTVVYCDRKMVRSWNCTRCHGNVESYKLHRLVFSDSWDLTAMVGQWPLLDAVFVTFRGTDSHDLGNWIADIDFRMIEYPIDPMHHGRSIVRGGGDEDSAERGVGDDTRAFVHDGFYRSLMQSGLYQGVHDALHTLRAELGGALPQLYVTGHSLGAAMAALAVPMLVRDFSPPSVRLYTFGCPRTGNQAFVDLVMQCVDYSVRFTHDHDVVPSLPPPYLGFRHFPHEVWQVTVLANGQTGGRLAADNNDTGSSVHMDSFVLHPDGKPGAFVPQQPPGRTSDKLSLACSKEGSVAEPSYEFMICDGSGEDPNCHDSVCYWFPCHSFHDHIFYLGKHMYHRVGEC
eukprot:jgi/Ulvmu1/11033/UM007_0214.1